MQMGRMADGLWAQKIMAALSHELLSGNQMQTNTIYDDVRRQSAYGLSLEFTSLACLDPDIL